MHACHISERDLDVLGLDGLELLQPEHLIRIEHLKNVVLLHIAVHQI